MQHETFRNLESQADAFWYCLKISWLVYLSLFDETGSHSKKPGLFWNIAIVCYRSLVMTFIEDESDGVCLM